MNYYNEFDKHAAAWLRELIKAGLIANGDVDERDIREVKPSDLRGYTQCHFFAGIGGWSLALRLAGVSDDEPVWTGSCPCQPFSVAGKGGGAADSRHLWPEFARLIAECRPATVFGEQAASADGRQWLDGVRADLDVLGYAVACADLCAAGVNAPHIRQRLFWVADADRGRFIERDAEPEAVSICAVRSRANRRLEHSRNQRHGEARSPESRSGIGGTGAFGGLADSTSRGLRIDGRASGNAGHADERGEIDGMGDTDSATGARLGRYRGQVVSRNQESNGHHAPGPWTDSQDFLCQDGKLRRIPTEPALFPLASGLPARVVSLRGAGNAICPEITAEFIKAYEAARGELAR